MLKKMMFLAKALEKANHMDEKEWKEWALKEGKKAGFTENDLKEALFNK